MIVHSLGKTIIRIYYYAPTAFEKIRLAMNSL